MKLLVVIFGLFCIAPSVLPAAPSHRVKPHKVKKHKVKKRKAAKHG